MANHAYQIECLQNEIIHKKNTIHLDCSILLLIYGPLHDTKQRICLKNTRFHDTSN